MSSTPPIRSKILKILLVPLISLVALWAFLSYSMVAETSGFAQSRSEWDAVGAPARALIVEVQRERQLSAELAGDTAGDTAGDKRATRRATRGSRRSGSAPTRP